MSSSVSVARGVDGFAVAGRRRAAGAALAGALALSLLAPAPAGAEESAESGAVTQQAADRAYEAEIRRTEFGIPHVKADDLPSVSFGAGFAFAEDNLCAFAQAIVGVRAQRSVVFGGTEANRVSDLFHQRIIDRGGVEEVLEGPEGPSDEVRDGVRGYVAGFNHYLEDVAPDEHTDPACAGEDWVRPITEIELWRYYNTVLTFAGETFVSDAIVAAQPPSTSSGAVSGAGADDLDDLDADALGEALVERFGSPGGTQGPATRGTDGGGGAVGSNAYALGAEATVDGTGMVLGNPHFPWQGPQRFYQQHLTVPGEMDVAGASLFGQPVVNIGHNESVAWSHTVSTADRFTLHLVELVPGEPTTYVVDDEQRQMTSTEVEIEVPDGEGGTQTVSHTFWETHLGPVIDFPPLVWGEQAALVFNDVNVDQMRAADSWLAMNRAGSVEELLAGLDETQGVPWVNTIAADADGTALYADHSVVPHLTDAQRADCTIIEAMGFAILDGARGACEPGSDPDAVTDGILGPDALPVLLRDDYVANMNNSYWLANPEQPLEGFARIIGSERSDIGLRARLGLHMVEERLAGEDGLAGTGFTRERLQELMFNNRNLGAEMVRDDLVAACRDADEQVEVDGTTVDLAEACDVLEAWDTRVDLDSVGAHVFREFARAGGIRFAEPFDPQAPLTTPHTLDTDDARVLRALGQGVRRLEDAGIPLDATLGQLQSVTRDGERIPIHGGSGGEGIFNVISAPWQGEDGYPEVASGSSFVMATELTPDGPRSASILTYSQSTDPTSPHYADQTRRFSDKAWIEQRFTEEDILADPELTVRSVALDAVDPAPTPRASFPDVAASNVHAGAIARLADDGILLGFADGTFRPTRPITRGQVALVVARAFDIEPVTGGPFPDVTGDGEQARAVNGLAAEGIVLGFPDGTYRPGARISRGELATTLGRTLGTEGLDQGPFTDVAGSAHAPQINALTEAGIVQGFADGTFRPQRPITRAQAASLVDRAR